jgi:hypothetical protein
MGGSQGQFVRIKARQREQDLAWMDEQRRRDCDRLEQAIRFLRSRGYIVAPSGNPGAVELRQTPRSRRCGPMRPGHAAGLPI